jgi:ArsR family transcriptional regulator, arsenate/arsenite/antimonite-responsive transcriptional repressor
MKSLPVINCCAPLDGPALDDGEAVGLEQLLRALADRHRLKILNTLVRAGGEALCVCEFEPILGLKQPTVSYHLKQLTDAGVLDREKRGTNAYYSIAPGALERIRSVFMESQADLAAA